MPGIFVTAQSEYAVSGSGLPARMGRPGLPARMGSPGVFQAVVIGGSAAVTVSSSATLTSALTAPTEQSGCFGPGWEAMGTFGGSTGMGSITNVTNGAVWTASLNDLPLRILYFTKYPRESFFVKTNNLFVGSHNVGDQVIIGVASWPAGSLSYIDGTYYIDEVVPNLSLTLGNTFGIYDRYTLRCPPTSISGSTTVSTAASGTLTSSTPTQESSISGSTTFSTWGVGTLTSTLATTPCFTGWDANLTGASSSVATAASTITDTTNGTVWNAGFGDQNIYFGRPGLESSIVSQYSFFVQASAVFTGTFEVGDRIVVTNATSYVNNSYYIDGVALNQNLTGPTGFSWNLYALRCDP